MVRLSLLVVLGVLASSCGSDEASTPDPTDVSTTLAANTESTTTTTTTTDAPAAPQESTGPIVGDGIAVTAGPTLVINRTDGWSTLDNPACLSPTALLTDSALVLSCPTEGRLISVAWAGGSPATRDDRRELVSSGADWVLVCGDADDVCDVLDAVTLAPRRSPQPIPGGAPPWTNSGLAELLVVGRADDLALYAVTDVVTQVRSGLRDTTWGDLVELGDGRVAMEVRVDTGGIDTRPEAIVYADPRTGDPLDYDDGADHNRLFDVGVASVRVTPELTLQRERVRAFTPDGTELWMWPDDSAVAAEANGRVWLAAPGTTTIVEIDPATAAIIGEVDLPAPVADRSLRVHPDGWLAVRVDGPVGEQVVVVAV